MKLDTLTLENFRKFERAELEFPDGVVGIVGRNGAGKSTLIEALGWALFGNEVARTPKDLIRRSGAGEKADCRVRVAFTFGGHAYEVTRELIGKTQSHVCTVKVDGKVVVPGGAKSHKEATRYLERAFHMDRHAFFVSLVARQRELNALTDLTPGARQKVVLSLLRIDAVDEAVRLARESKRDLKAKLDAITAQLTDPAVLEAREKEARAAREEAAEARDRVWLEAEALNETLQTRRRERDAWEEKAERHHALSVNLTRVKERAASARRDLEKAREDLREIARVAVELESLAPEVEGVDAARAELERLQEARTRWLDVERRRRELTQAEAEVARLEVDAERADAEAVKLSAVRKLLDRARLGRERVREREAALERRIAELDASLARVKGDVKKLTAQHERVTSLGPESPCPTCTRPLGEHYDTLTSEFERNAADLREEEAGVTRERADVIRERDAVRQEARKLADAEQEYARKADALSTLEGKRAAMRERLDAERSRAERLRDALAALDATPVEPDAVDAARKRVADLDTKARRAAALEAQVARRGDVEQLIDALAAKVEAADADVARALEEVKDLGFDADAYQRARKAVEDVQVKLSEKRVELERVTAAIQRADEALAHVAESRERQRKLESETRDAREELRYLERLAGDRGSGLLVDFKQHLIARVRPTLSAHAGALFRDLTDGKYTDLEVDADYDLVVHEDGDRFNLDRYSGGETDLANLCLRLAVSRVLAERAGGDDFSFIVLDEIFGSQDEVRKGNILRAMGELRGKFRQILVITHVDDVKEACERVVRVTEDEHGVSHVTVE